MVRSKTHAKSKIHMTHLIISSSIFTYGPSAVMANWSYLLLSSLRINFILVILRIKHSYELDKRTTPKYWWQMFFSKDQSKLMGTVTSRGQIHFQSLNDKLILQVPLSKPTAWECLVLPLYSKLCQQLVEGHVNFRNVHSY